MIKFSNMIFQVIMIGRRGLLYYLFVYSKTIDDDIANDNLDLLVVHKYIRNPNHIGKCSVTLLHYI